MAVHQYIGARYVPYYYENSLDPTSTEWEPNVNYEALTVVTLPNQHSYISKKTVPDTIGSPALNPEYWLDTGSDNAYIQQLRADVDDINDVKIPGLQDQIDPLKTKTANLPDRKILFIGDSYAGVLAPDNRNFCQIAGDAIGCAYDIVKHAGIGFTNINGQGTFLDYLQTVTTDRDSYTDIVVCGGCNDYADIPDTIAAIGTFCNYVYEHFPNATIHIGMIGGFNDARKTSQIALKALPAYRSCGRFKAHYMSGLEYVMYNTNVFESDHVHPVSSHIPVIGYAVADAFFGKYYSQYMSSAAPTAMTGSGFTVSNAESVNVFQLDNIVGFACNSYRFCVITITDATQALNSGLFEHKILSGLSFRGFPSGWTTGRYAIPVKCGLSPSNTELYGLLYANSDGTLSLSVTHVPSTTTTMVIQPLSICQMDFDITRF